MGLTWCILMSGSVLGIDYYFLLWIIVSRGVLLAMALQIGTLCGIICHFWYV